MERQSGIHFYINIANFNEIILQEEKKSKGKEVTHSIHALDTFFTSVESFGKGISKNLVVEKITGSRLHMYVVGELEPAFQVVKVVTSYSFNLARYIKTDISKYKSLLDFYITVYSYGTNLIVKNWSDYVTYHKSNDKNEIVVSYNLNPYGLKNPRKPEFISLVLKYYSSLDLYSFIKFNDNARVLFKIDNSNNAIDEMDVELKGSLGRYIGKPASFKIKEGINDCEIKLLDFKSNQLKEIDEICFVLRPEHSIGNKGTFVIKDLRISIY